MFYSLTKEYLMQHCDSNNQNSFSEESSQLLVEHLQSLNPGISISDHKDEIRDALRDFWSSLGKVFVFFKGQEHISVKIIPNEEIVTSKAIIRQLATSGEEEKFVRNLVFSITEDVLDFKKIRNRTFEATYLAHIKTRFFKQILKNTQNNQNLATEVSLDLIRDYFHIVHDTLAEALLESFLTNKKAEEFLDNYGKTYIGEGGIRFRTPDIMDRQKRLWHKASIRPVVMKHQKQTAIIKTYEKNLQRLKNNLQKAEEESIAVEASLAKYEDQFKEASVKYTKTGEKLTSLRNELARCRGLLNVAKDSEKDIYQNEIDTIIKDIDTTKIEDGGLKYQKSKAEKRVKERENKLVNLKKEIFGIEQHIKIESENFINQKRKFGDLKNTYELIVDALGNALMKRKRIVG